MTLSTDIIKIRELKAQVAELTAKNNDLWTELNVAYQKTIEDRRVDELQARIKELEAVLQYFYDYGYDRGKCEAALQENEL